MDGPPELTPASPWQVFLLGGLRLLQHGKPVAPPPYRSQSLLAAILMHIGPVQRERLAARFFPDLPESTSRARLSDRLWLIKKSLKRFPIESSPTEITVDPQCVWVDIIAFREAARQSGPAGWAQAVSLYTGELLPGHYDDWLLVERENLHLLYVETLQKLAAHALAGGGQQPGDPAAGDAVSGRAIR
jgi:DNA-binding SARP family transcriptional activator